MTISSQLRSSLFMLCLAASSVFADGLMRPVDKSYPKDFLRLRMTKIDVTLNGQIAVTTVYQEFVNEWQQKTSAVFSFPLPPDARATDFFFWSNDTMYQAVLKVKEQAVNPGTGEGGIDALLNAYLGSNALRVLINDVPAGKIQKTQLEYVSLCSYDRGRIQYTFPFNTQDFVTTPIETFSLAVHINAAADIIDAGIAEYPGVQPTHKDARHAELLLERSKVFPTSDLSVGYTVGNDSLSVDCYSIDTDSLDGHFALFMTPPSTFTPAQALNKNIVFLLDHSQSTAGVALDASKTAIQQCLTKLRQTDRFNIVIMNSSVTPWNSQPVPATPANVAAAASYLAGITASGGSNLAGGIANALGMITSDSLNNVVMVFSDGQSVVDPKVVTAQNTFKAGIFPIGIGTAANRARLEMIAYQNYGYPTFIAVTDPIYDAILAVFDRIGDPIMKNTMMEFGSNAYDMLPQTLQSVYFGSRFFITGRYKDPGTTTLSIAGYSAAGPRFFDFQLKLSSDKTTNKFAQKLWGKEKIDALERQIAVYGATDSLKQLTIKYSLLYNIRCQYTAYLADKTNPVVVSAVDECTLENFTVTRTEGGVCLHWSLRGKEQVSECVVYRSVNPYSGFTRIGAAPAGDESFTDSGASTQSAFYRLEIVTRSGKRFTSATISAAGGVVPLAFDLHQNYPNPFNPSTSITFSLPLGTHGRTSLRIYDLLGRECAVLADEPLQPGLYTRVWNASGVPSGMYVYVLRSGASVASGKMILQK